MEQFNATSTLPFKWIFSTREFADRFHPALIIWETTAGKPEIRSSILLGILLKVFHILSKKPGVSKTLEFNFFNFDCQRSRRHNFGDSINK